MKDNEKIKKPDHGGSGGKYGNRTPYKNNSNYLLYVIVAVVVISVTFLILR